MRSVIIQRVLRLLASIAAVAAVTFAAHSLTPVNATTVGLAYLLLVLVIASAWGFIEASISSILATLIFNFYFLPPVGTFTIADPQNWIALFSFLSTALIASRLSAKAEQRALEAIKSQQDLERLYTFSRAILLIGSDESFPRQLVTRLADIFGLTAATLLKLQAGLPQKKICGFLAYQASTAVTSSVVMTFTACPTITVCSVSSEHRPRPNGSRW